MFQKFSKKEKNKILVRYNNKIYFWRIVEQNKVRSNLKKLKNSNAKP